MGKINTPTAEELRAASVGSILVGEDGVATYTRIDNSSTPWGRIESGESGVLGWYGSAGLESTARRGNLRLVTPSLPSDEPEVVGHATALREALGWAEMSDDDRAARLEGMTFDEVRTLTNLLVTGYEEARGDEHAAAQRTRMVQGVRLYVAQHLGRLVPGDLLRGPIDFRA